MSQSNASSPPGQPEPQPSPREGKAGFFAAAGKRLKRVLSGSAEEPAQVTAAAAPESQTEAPQTPEEVGQVGEVETSVQARARELVQHDRAYRSQRAGVNAKEDARVSTPPPPPPPRTREAAPEPHEAAPRARKPSVPPPLPKQRLAAPKRAGRDTKTAELRARLGAAKAQLADAQAKRVPTSAAPSSAPLATADVAATATANAAESGNGEGNPDPIRTLTIARLLAGQGYLDRSLSIYDELLAESPTDAELRAEAEAVRSRQTGKQEAESASQQRAGGPETPPPTPG